MKWRLAGVVGKPRLIVFGWFCAATLAVVGTIVLFSTTADSHDTRIATSTFSLPSSDAVSAGGGTIITMRGAAHAAHPVLGTALLMAAIAIAVLTLRLTRPDHGVAGA